MAKLTKIPVNCWEPRKALFGKRFENSSLSTLNSWPESEAKKAWDWLKNPEGFLVIQGGPGSGKTMFCAAVLREQWTNCPNVYATHENKFYGEIKKGWRNKWDETEHIEHMLHGAEAVIYNDFGTQKPGEWTEQALFTLVEGIYERSIPAIITTNLTDKEIEQRVHARIPSRLFSKPGERIELWDVADFRKEKSDD